MRNRASGNDERAAAVRRNTPRVASVLLAACVAGSLPLGAGPMGVTSATATNAADATAQAAPNEPGPAPTPELSSFPHDPRNPDSASVWANPDGRSTDPHTSVGLSIEAISQPLITLPAPNAAPGTGAGTTSPQAPVYTLAISNSGSSPVRDLRIGLRIGRNSNADEIRVALLANTGEYPGAPVQVDVPGEVAPGATKRVAVTVDVRDKAPGQTSPGQAGPSQANPSQASPGPGATPATSPSASGSSGTDQSSAPSAPPSSGSASPSAASASATPEPPAPNADARVRIPAAALGDPGAYPLLFSVQARGGSSDGDLGAVARTTATVVRGSAGAAEASPGTTARAGSSAPTAGPGAPQAPGTLAPPPTDPNTPAPTPLTFLWPLAAETHRVAGATGSAPERAPLYLSEDSLATELAAGGRLRSLLDAYRDSIAGPAGAQMKAASCLAIDPELLDTVDAMTRGYLVGPRVPSPVTEQKRLRDSWGDILNNQDDDARPGSGQDAATAWLEDLRSLVQNQCTVALPYAGAELSELANAGDDWLAVHALARGSETVFRVLGVYPVPNVVVPGSGGVSADATRLLAGGATKGIDASLSTRFEVLHKGAPALPAEAQVTAVVADNTVAITRPTLATPPTGVGESTEAGTGTAAAPGASAPGQPDAQTRAWNDRLVTLPTSPDAPGHQFRALRYSGGLGAVLAATGEHPDVAAYANPTTRYDLATDSPAARMADAIAVLSAELNSGAPTLAVPPALWSVNGTDARALLGSIQDAFVAGRATPAGFGDALNPRGITPGQLAEAKPIQPFPDPGSISLERATYIGELQRRVTELTLLMRNDPKIALTREIYTRPLSSDLLRAASGYRLRERSAWEAVRASEAARLATVDSTLTTLRRSVTLLPPGNVFTRTSDSAPLLVVAQNGLPLPVPATVSYTQGRADGAGHTRIEQVAPDAQQIPARGSITVPIPAAATGGEEATLSLWLSTPEGAQISQPVRVRIQSVPLVSLPAALGLMFLLVAVGALGLWWRDRRRKVRAAEQTADGAAEQTAEQTVDGTADQPAAHDASTAHVDAPPASAT